MNPPAADRRVLVSVLKGYVAGADTRGRQEGQPYPWSQQVIHEIPGLKKHSHGKLPFTLVFTFIRIRIITPL